MYIMSPDIFKSLSKNTVSHISDNTYQEYIIKKLDNILLEEQKCKIMNTNSPEKALEMLKLYNINYTHKY
jgi:hypothetical protein